MGLSPCGVGIAVGLIVAVGWMVGKAVGVDVLLGVIVKLGVAEGNCVTGRGICVIGTEVEIGALV